MEKEVFSTCTWCNKNETLITCACCKEPVKYGDSFASGKLKIDEKGLRICKKCMEEETNVIK